MALTVVSDIRGIHASTSDWAELHRVSRSDNPFAHPYWCAAWVEAYRPRRVHILIMRDDSGRLQAVIPLASQGRNGKHWSTLGTPLVDFGDPLIPPGHEGVQVLLRSLAECATHWNSVSLTGLRPGLAGALMAEATCTGLSCGIDVTQTCPCVFIPSLEAWKGSLPPARWRRLALVRRRVEDQLGAVCTEARSPSDVARAVRRFEALRLQSWWQRGRLHELPRETRGAVHGTLLRRAATRLAAIEGASVVELTAGTRLLAASLLLWSGDSVLVALKATDTRLGPAFSPGLALDVFTVEHAVTRGVGSVGFGRGDERYKFVLGAQPVPTVDVVVRKCRGALLRLRQGVGGAAAWSTRFGETGRL